jgi:beta-glucanase (GH16 family)
MAEQTDLAGHRRLPWILLACMVSAVLIIVAVATTRSGSQSSGTPLPTHRPSAPEQSAPEEQAPWELLWSDEFDGPAGVPPNDRNWTYETGGGGWGNEELQYYTDGTDNGALDGDGHLVITARAIDPAGTDLSCWYGQCAFTSARLISQDKQAFQYGRFEARAMLPEGAGLWPALWMLGADIREVGWPQSGEIDLMEFVGRSPNEIFGTIHGPGYSGGDAFHGARDLGAPVPGGWHEFVLEWSPESIVWMVDGVPYHHAQPSDVAPDQWVFDQPFFLLINLAVGGNFGGPLGEDVSFPRELVVDYVRVYEAS